jgi:predicted adenine nucleotide alpha hydrolase (AANH) superfamily ATPase
MKILLHICCAPCALMPVEILQASHGEVKGYFFNPNIQPYKEYERRLAPLAAWAQNRALPLEAAPYQPLEWLRLVVPDVQNRCQICYQIRLEQSARQARRNGCRLFTTTLLYSLYQDREKILAAGRMAGERAGIEFMEADFRPWWSQGRQKAKNLNLYRQPYCGCIFSEAERYMKKTNSVLPVINGENNAPYSS